MKRLILLLSLLTLSVPVLAFSQDSVESAIDSGEQFIQRYESASPEQRYSMVEELRKNLKEMRNEIQKARTSRTIDGVLFGVVGFGTALKVISLVQKGTWVNDARFFSNAWSLTKLAASTAVFAIVAYKTGKDFMISNEQCNELNKSIRTLEKYLFRLQAINTIGIQ